jgi:hypothetical protein
MAANDTGEASPMLTWPYVANSTELGAVLATLGIEPTAVSPAAVVADPSSAPLSAAERLSEQAQSDPRLRLALLTLAAPSRLFSFATLSGADLGGWLFLVGEHAAVAFQIVGDAIGFSPAFSADELAALITRLAAAPETDDRPAELLPSDILPVLAELIGAGVAQGTPATVPEDRVLAAIGAALGSATEPATGLAALEQDGVIVRSADGVRLTDAWVERFGYLIDDRRVELTSVELADAKAGFESARRVVIVGEAGRQRITQHGVENGRAFVLMAPLTARLLITSVLNITASPTLPRLATEMGDSDGLSRWLQPAESSAAELPGEWHIQTRSELIADAASDGPAGTAMAVLGPLAELGIATHRPRHAVPERSVVGLTAHSAVQWILDGSRVRWRSLPVGAIDQAVRDLLPVGHSADVDGATAVSVSPEELSALAAGQLDQERRSSLPDSLRSLGAGDKTTWCALHTSVRGLVDPQPVLLGFGADAVVWQLEGAEHEALARRVSPAQVADEIREALTP